MKELDRYERQGELNRRNEPPCKVCLHCGTVVHVAVRICPECEQVFPRKNEKD
jgi:hypothetical protein